MAVKIRLSRIGKTHTPFYRIVVVDGRKQRDGESLEIVGTYDPIAGKLIQFQADRIDAWLSKGAIASDSVKKLQKLHKQQNDQK